MAAMQERASSVVSGGGAAFATERLAGGGLTVTMVEESSGEHSMHATSRPCGLRVGRALLLHEWLEGSFL